MWSSLYLALNLSSLYIVSGKVVFLVQFDFAQGFGLLVTHQPILHFISWFCFEVASTAYISYYSAAPDRLSCWLPEEIAKLAFVFSVGGVPAFCWLKMEGDRFEISGDLWCLATEALPLQHYLPVPRIRFEEETIDLQWRECSEAPDTFSLAGTGRDRTILNSFQQTEICTSILCTFLNFLHGFSLGIVFLRLL